MTYSPYFPADVDVFGEVNKLLSSISSCMPDLDRCGDEIRRVTSELDFVRVLFLRGRRMVLLSVALLEQHVESYGPWIRFLDSLVEMFVLYHAVILLPRFFLNLSYIFSTPWSPEMNGPYRDMLYDLGWIMTGVLSFFVLVGSLAACAPYLAVATPTYHLFVNAMHCLVEYDPTQTFETNYDKLMPLMIRVGVSACIVSAAVVMLVCCTNPILAFSAAAVAVLATIAGKMVTDCLTKKELESPLIAQSTFSSQASVEKKDAESIPQLLV